MRYFLFEGIKGSKVKCKIVIHMCEVKRQNESYGKEKLEITKGGGGDKVQNDFWNKQSSTYFGD